MTRGIAYTVSEVRSCTPMEPYNEQLATVT